MEVSDAKRLKSLEEGEAGRRAFQWRDRPPNAKLKRLLADAMLDAAALKDLLGKKR